MDLSAGELGATAAAIGVPVVFALIRYVKTLQYTGTSAKDLDQLKEEYGTWEILGSFLMLTIAAVIGVALWQLFLFLAELQSSRLSGSQFLIFQPSVGLVLPAIFLAIFLSAIPMHFLYLRLLGPERYEEYTHFTNQKVGIDSWKLLRAMAWVMVPLCIIFTFLSLDSYVRVTENGIGVNSFFGVGERGYSFDEIEQIKLVKSFEAPSGDIVRRPYFIFAFSDGDEINFHRTIHELSLKEQDEITRYLSSRSGRRIVVDDPYPQ